MNTRWQSSYSKLLHLGTFNFCIVLCNVLVVLNTNKFLQIYFIHSSFITRLQMNFCCEPPTAFNWSLLARVNIH